MTKKFTLSFEFEHSGWSCDDEDIEEGLVSCCKAFLQHNGIADEHEVIVTSESERQFKFDID